MCNVLRWVKNLGFFQWCYFVKFDETQFACAFLSLFAFNKMSLKKAPSNEVPPFVFLLFYFCFQGRAQLMYHMFQLPSIVIQKF